MPQSHLSGGCRISIIEQNEDHVVLQNNELDENVKQTKENFRKYQLAEMPDGYSLESEEFDEGFQKFFATYTNSSDDVLTLKQTWQEDESPEKLTSDTSAIEDVKVSGFTGYYAEDNGMGSLVLSNGIYRVVLDGAFSKEELVELAENLELVNQPID